MSEPLPTAAQMRAVETAAIESGRVTGLELMERAGRGAVEAILAEWPDMARAPGRAVVLCGPGNNGGDGFVVARLLAGRGWGVECFLLGDAERLPPDARANFERWTGPLAPLPPPVDHPRWDGTHWTGRDVDLVIDAVFGIGLSRPLAEDLIGFFHAVDNFDGGRRARHVALDVPSGLQSDSGRALPATFPTDLTVTFHAAKPGHHLADGPARCGRMRIVGIGLSGVGPGMVGASPDDAAPAVLIDADDAWAATKRAGHKYDHGHALVLAGGMGRTGAARLAARAALRIGAGLVTLGAPGGAMMECAAQVTALMLRRCEDGDALAALLEDDRISALCLGPGLGVDDRGRGLVAAALASGRACVLDADALTLIAGDDALRAAVHDRCVLTPHGGEFARLFPDQSDRLSAPAETGPACSKIDATREAAAAIGATVLFKGPDTVIADPQGAASVQSAAYDRAAPWLATAGAGDVLAGMIAGLLARGVAPMPACEAAAWLHVEAARGFGPGLIAEDLPDLVPHALRAAAP